MEREKSQKNRNEKVSERELVITCFSKDSDFKGGQNEYGET